MKLYRLALLCVCLMIAAQSGIANTPSPSKSDLLKLVKSHRAKVSDIDVRWTYVHETLANDPAEPDAIRFSRRSTTSNSAALCTSRTTCPGEPVKNHSISWSPMTAKS